MARYNSVRPVAIALVVQNDDGSLTLMGSKSIRTSQVEWSIATSERLGYSIEAECYDLTIQRTMPVPCPPHLEQRGIYLPDMSFRALPSPEEP